MGNCFTQPSIRRRNRRSTYELNGRLALGKGEALRQELIKWKSGLPLTRDQILSKRAEFWHTAPAFEGRQEIWDALHVATEALEKGDHELAQAIVDGANIIVPYGILTECYDELGNRYILPPYVLSFPMNVIDTLPENTLPTDCPDAGATDNSAATAAELPSTATNPASATTVPTTPDCDPKILCTATILKKPSEGLRGLLQLSDGIGEALQRHCQLQQQQSTWVQLPCRLSTGHEILMLCSLDDKISDLKQRLTATMRSIPSLSTQLPSFGQFLENQRWFCAGRPLLESWRLVDCHVPTGWVVQVIVHAPKWQPAEHPKADKTAPGEESSKTRRSRMEEEEAALPYCDDTTLEEDSLVSVDVALKRQSQPTVVIACTSS